MANASVEAVVLRRWDSGESDRRLALLTSERGRVYAIARGARRAKSKLAGISEPLAFSKLELAFGHKNAYVVQAQPLSGFAGLRRDYLRLECALVWVEILNTVIPESEPSPDAFELAVATLRLFEDASSPVAVLAWADLRLMEISGIAPDFATSSTSHRLLLSPSDGAVVDANDLDGSERAFSVSRNAVIALGKLQSLDTPPGNLRPAADVTRVLLEFWIEFVGYDLPARRRLVNEVARTSAG